MLPEFPPDLTAAEPGPEHRFKIRLEEERERLDRVLAARIPQVSRMRLRELLDRGSVRIDGEPRAAGWRVTAGQLVTVHGDLAGATAMTPEAIPLEVLYEDFDLCVVVKPSDMVVHPAGQHRSGTLANALAYHFNVAGRSEPPVRPGIVHRLDRATSGLMVIAKTQPVLSNLTVQFQKKSVRKEYVALVHGTPDAGEGIWEAPIGSDPEATPRWGVRESGREARTHWTIQRRFPHHTLLALEPITGRTNQLRIHCAHFGHPILGDELFGRGPEHPPGRLFLHAAYLRFTHPTTHATMDFRAELPNELALFLTQIGA